MTEKLIKLIESELPEFFKIYLDVKDNLHDKSMIVHFELLIERELHRVYPHENQIEQRNNFRIKWNLILTENE